MEMSMEQMLHGVSMESSEDDATFCNLYTSDGYPLSNAVLGGFAVEANLFDALEHAEFDPGYSREKIISDFESAKEGEASFVYGDRSETLTYVPVAGTDWLLTYLVRESLISDMISDITSGYHSEKHGTVGTDDARTSRDLRLHTEAKPQERENNGGI